MAVAYRRMGTVELRSPFTLAALSGYSDLGMRVTCRAQGACLTRHEVVLDEFILQSGRGPRSGHHLDPNDRPIAAQLMGSDPARMADAARRMVSFGYDLIDINFGCPVKKVLGRCRGGYLLSQPAVAVEMVQRVRDAVNVPVTVKMRRGMDDSTQSADHFWEILETAVALGIVSVTVHGRSVRQRYEGRADWSVIGRVKKKFPDLVVMGSGDLFTASDCLDMLEKTGCDGVTIARGAIENPWIFRKCLALWEGRELPAPPTLDEQADLLDWQYRLCVEQYGPERASRQIRKFGIKRAWLHPSPTQVQEAFIHLSCPADWDRLRRRYYRSELPADEREGAVA